MVLVNKLYLETQVIHFFIIELLCDLALSIMNISLTSV